MSNELLAEIEILDQQIKREKERLKVLEGERELRRELLKVSQFRELSQEMNIDLYSGLEFTVNSEMNDYAKEQGWCEGYYPPWQVGQKAAILNYHNGDNIHNLRCTCEYGIFDLGGLSTPFPVELIVDAIRQTQNG